jgi:tetratricopeptide (TPR) repeat protein
MAAAVLFALSFRVSTVAEGGIASAEALAEADRLWAERGDGATSGEVPASRIEPVIAACRRAIELDPKSLEPRWRLMRAFYFKGEYTTRDPEEKKRIFDEGKKAGEEAIALIRSKVAAATGRPTENDGPLALAPAARAIPGAAPTFLWAGVDWGKWALVYGKVAAAKKGAAAKIRDDAEAVILIDPSYDEGAGYRLLGRLHHQTPRIPFITFWASRSEALRNLNLALEEGPRNFYNRLYWAEALRDYEPSRRSEARRVLETLVSDTPSDAFNVEDRRVQEEAKALLATWGR